MIFTKNDLVCKVEIGIWTLKQSNPEFYSEHIPDRSVQFFNRHDAFYHQLNEMITEAAADHIHVNAGFYRHLRGLGFISGNSLQAEIINTLEVGYHKTVETPFLPEHVLQQIFACRARNAVNIIECRHNSGNAGFDCGPEIRQINIPQSSFRNIRVGMVASPDGGPVAGKVFDASGYFIRCAKFLPLVPADRRERQFTAKIRVFSEAFRDSSPARIPRNIHHRRKSPADAGTRGFSRRD